MVVVDTKLMISFLRLAAIQGIERKQNSSCLAPQGGFIAAKAIERKIGQIG